MFLDDIGLRVNARHKSQPLSGPKKPRFLG